MRIVKQSISLPILNYELDECNRKSSRHGELLPNSIRAIISGPSGAGKTSVMINLLCQPNGLRFENIYIYSKSLYQPKYEFLRQILKKAPEITYHEFTDNDIVIDPNEAKQNSVFIFDDVACDKQDKIRQFFCMGRHKAVDSFYLCQTYTRIPKHLIRDNANVIILFKQDDMNLRHAYTDHVGTDMPFNQFKDMCSKCWATNYDFLVILKDMDIKDGRYRKCFDHYIYL